MSAPTRPVHPEVDASRRVTHIPGEPGVWVFILGDMAVFAVLFVTYLYYRGRAPGLFNHSQHMLESTYGFANTLILLLSSLLVVTAVQAIRIRARSLAQKLIIGAIVCGIGFSTLKVIEYQAKIAAGIGPSTNDFFMYYYVLTGLHWFHLIIGLAVLVVLLILTRRPEMSARQFAFVEGGACFWHMIDLLWIVLFPLLYLVR